MGDALAKDLRRDDQFADTAALLEQRALPLADAGQAADEDQNRRLVFFLRGRFDGREPCF
ncbi:hypothetical protein D3C84_973280 [compost metagenome]